MHGELQAQLIQSHARARALAVEGQRLEAYERLILDVMRGDHTLFTTAEGIERLWEVSIPLLEAPPPVRLYPPARGG